MEVRELITAAIIAAISSPLKPGEEKTEIDSVSETSNSYLPTDNTTASQELESHYTLCFRNNE